MHKIKIYNNENFIVLFEIKFVIYLLNSAMLNILFISRNILVYPNYCDF